MLRDGFAAGPDDPTRFRHLGGNPSKRVRVGKSGAVHSGNRHPLDPWIEEIICIRPWHLGHACKSMTTVLAVPQGPLAVTYWTPSIHQWQIQPGEVDDLFLSAKDAGVGGWTACPDRVTSHRVDAGRLERHVRVYAPRSRHAYPAGPQPQGPFALTIWGFEDSRARRISRGDGHETDQERARRSDRACRPARSRSSRGSTGACGLRAVRLRGRVEGVVTWIRSDASSRVLIEQAAAAAPHRCEAASSH
jgi:hypothetical protein